MRKTCLFLWIPTLTFFLVACSLPAPAAPTTSPQEAAAAYTAAAQTIMAQLTQVAQTLTPPPPQETSALPTPGGITGSGTPGAPTLADTPTATQPDGSPTPTATATSTILPGASPTPTDTPGDPKLTLGDPDFSDTFRTSANWPLYTDDHVSFEIGNRRLVMTAFDPDGWDGWMLSWPAQQDFYLEMIAEPRQCSGLDRYGLVARAVKTSKGYANYLFGVSCDGRYSLRYWDGEKFATLIDWTESEHLRAGPEAVNRLGLYADGERLALYGNGKLLQELEDASSEEGKFGVFVGSDETEDFSVRVEEIAAWDLD
jgi:hypothetical protein